VLTLFREYEEEEEKELSVLSSCGIVVGCLNFRRCFILTRDRNNKRTLVPYSTSLKSEIHIQSLFKKENN